VIYSLSIVHSETAEDDLLHNLHLFKLLFQATEGTVYIRLQKLYLLHNLHLFKLLFQATEGTVYIRLQKL
jgi:virulence-associated protein VapD